MIEKIKYVIARLLTRKPVAVKNSSIDQRAAIGNGAQIVDSSVGKYTYIYESKVISSDVGSFCSIAADCTIGGGAHPIDWVSSSPVFYSGKNSLKKNFSNNNFIEYKRTFIGNDVWIGSKCLIKGGVRISDGAIIGMGSVVTHDVPPYEIWAGNPAHFIRKRFDDEIITQLLNSHWWDKDDAYLTEMGDSFSDVSRFINMIANDENG